jgi:hypothetical protein
MNVNVQTSKTLLSTRHVGSWLKSKLLERQRSEGLKLEASQGGEVIEILISTTNKKKKSGFGVMCLSSQLHRSPK